MKLFTESIRRLTLLICLLSVSIDAETQVYTPETVPDVKKNSAGAYVCNPDRIISYEAQNSIDGMLGELEAVTTVETDVVILNSIGNEDPDMFTNKLFNKWGTGKRDKNNGLMILFVLDERFVRIETGYGLEGILTDAVCSRIIRHQMIQNFKDEKYDEGFISAIETLKNILTDSEHAEELMSELKPNVPDVYPFILPFLIINLIVLVVIFYFVVGRLNRRKTNYDKYNALSGKINSLGCLVFFIPLAVIPFFIWVYFKKKILRRKPVGCDKCGNVMTLLDKTEKRLYLNKSRMLEQNLGSTDYDVHHCTVCGNLLTLPFINNLSRYKQCRQCGVRSYVLVSDVVIAKPTSYRQGVGLRTYRCEYCNFTDEVKYSIAYTDNNSISGGGFSGGGSRGGGSSGGGGASGRW